MYTKTQRDYLKQKVVSFKSEKWNLSVQDEATFSAKKIQYSATLLTLQLLEKNYVTHNSKFAELKLYTRKKHITLIFCENFNLFDKNRNCCKKVEINLSRNKSFLTNPIHFLRMYSSKRKRFQLMTPVMWLLKTLDMGKKFNFSIKNTFTPLETPIVLLKYKKCLDIKINWLHFLGSRYNMLQTIVISSRVYQMY